MDILQSLLQQLTPEQKAAMVQQLLGGITPAPATTTVAPPAPVAIAEPPRSAPDKRWVKPAKGGVDMSSAVEVSFRASLTANERCRDQSWAEQFDHVWFKGHYQVKGPKGGVYCLGRCVLGNAKREQLKGTLKISNRSYLQLAAGEAIDGWFIPDDSKDNIFLGTLSNLQPLT